MLMLMLMRALMLMLKLRELLLTPREPSMSPM
jgi:hypothetical protein